MAPKSTFKALSMTAAGSYPGPAEDIPADHMTLPERQSCTVRQILESWSTNGKEATMLLIDGNFGGWKGGHGKDPVAAQTHS